MEADSEDDSDEQSTEKLDGKKQFKAGDKEEKSSPQDFAIEVINELIDIVLESAGEVKTLESSEIVNNALLQQNVHRLHKQVFVKVRVKDNSHIMSTTGSKVTDSVDIISMKSFKSR